MYEMAGDDYNIHKLPEDLLVEIFLRSSVGSLLRAKCVCRKWYGVIKDPSFAYKHLQYQKNRNRDRILLQYFKEETQEYHHALLDDKTLACTVYYSLDCLQVPYHTIHMEGPVDGLYCLFNNYDRVVLWNPALMEFKTLPLPLPYYKVYSCNGIGFGMDPFTNDYKVVLILYLLDAANRTPDSLPCVTVYNLRTNTWRLLDLGDFLLCDYSFTNNFSSSFLNGIYHWWVASGVVLTFDMGKETFREIPGPDISQFDYITGTLTLYKECVALMLSNYSFVYMWVMLEEGVWVKQLSVGPLQGLVWPLGFWENKGILLIYNDSEPTLLNPNSQMVLYDVGMEEIRVVGPNAMDHRFRALVYYESLISVDGRTECEEKCESVKHSFRLSKQRPLLLVGISDP